MTASAFLIGFAIGVNVGVLVVSLVTAARSSDE